MKTAHFLRIALLSNAVFSVVCGLLMLVCPGFIGSLLGPQIDLLWRLLGLGLLIFAADLVHQATRPRLLTWRALYASVGDFLWVIGSAVGLLLFSSQFSLTGVVMVLVIAGVVWVFGYWQIWGIDRAHRAANPALYRHCLVVRTKASAAAMWHVIERMGDIQNYAPSLLRSELLHDQTPGLGVVRRCTAQSGRCWSEECVAFEPGHSFTMRFVAEAPDFPFPVSAMVGGWQVMSVEAGSAVKVWWELAPQPRFLAPVLLPILALGADRDVVQVIRRMEDDALAQKPDRARLETPQNRMTGGDMSSRHEPC
ncbi:MAG: SRPBCC family protein [Cyanobacteria bacterium J06639_14]